MKIGQFFQKMVGGSMILATLAAPVFTSCYDDAPLWDKVEDLDSRLTALEAKQYGMIDDILTKANH